MSAEMWTAVAVLAEQATGRDDNLVLALYRAVYNRPRATLAQAEAGGSPS